MTIKTIHLLPVILIPSLLLVYGLIVYFLKRWASSNKVILRKFLANYQNPYQQDKANLLQLLSIKNNCGETLLHWAAFKGHTEIVNKILSAFGDDRERLLQLLSIQDNNGNTPLHTAAIKDHTEIVNKILSAFENDMASIMQLLSIKSNLGDTPLHVAAINGHTEIVEMIINKLSPAEALQLLYETNNDGRNVYEYSEEIRHLFLMNYHYVRDGMSIMPGLLISIGANKTSKYLYINDQINQVSNNSFAAATHIVIPTDELKSRIPKKYHSKVINLTTKDIIEEAIKKAIENVVGKDDPISKELLKNEILIPDIISIITPYAITTIEILSLMESLRRVPYYGGGEKYQELLGFAAKLLVKNPLLKFAAIKFTGNYYDDKGLLSFVEQMLTNNYQLKININGQEQVSNLSDHFEKYHNDLNISKESVDNILTEIPKQPKFSFEQFKLSLIKAAETKVPVIPAGEFEKKHRAMTSPGTK